MSSEAFVLSAASARETPDAIRQALEEAGVKPAQVQDAVFGVEQKGSTVEAMRIARAADLACSAVSVSSSLRAIFFAAQSILSGDLELDAVVDEDVAGGSALVLSAPEPIGRWNLMPRARLAGRSLTGAAGALRTAGIAAGDVKVSREGDNLRLVGEVLDELERRDAQWGMVTGGELALVIERS